MRAGRRLAVNMGKGDPGVTRLVGIAAFALLLMVATYLMSEHYQPLKVRMHGMKGAFGTRVECKPRWDTIAEADRRSSASTEGSAKEGSGEPKVVIVTIRDTRDIDAELMPNQTHITSRGDAVPCHSLENKKSYAARHGYSVLDGTAFRESDRPPSWYKIKAVQSAFEDPSIDFVMWMDADALITNPRVPLSMLLPAEGGPDLLLTKDGGGANAGVWILRANEWGAQFLDTWWSQTAFIRPPGDSKSGDNDALKWLLTDGVPELQIDEHMGYAPQCAFNAYLWRSSTRTWARYLMNPGREFRSLYHPGDFVLHMAGHADKNGARAAALPQCAVHAQHGGEDGPGAGPTQQRTTSTKPRRNGPRKTAAPPTAAQEESTTQAHDDKGAGNVAAKMTNNDDEGASSAVAEMTNNDQETTERITHQGDTEVTVTATKEEVSADAEHADAALSP